MENIYIGVDGGGTKTKIMVENEAGELIGQARSGPANIRTSFEQAWESINSGTAEALAAAQIKLDDPHYQFHAGLALAGTEDPEASAKFLAKAHGFDTIKLASDAYAACLGVHDRADGAIIIVGTGVIGLQIFKGEASKVGGWGFPQSDAGGGAWLGMEAIRLTFKWIDGRVEYTPLLQAVFAHFNNDIDRLVVWCSNARPAQFATIAPIVIDYVGKEDSHALDLIQWSAREIDLVAHAMNKQLPPGQKPLPCCLMSGLAPFVQPHVSASLKGCLVERKHDATQGALYMIRDFVKAGNANQIVRETVNCINFKA